MNKKTAMQELIELLKKHHADINAGGCTTFITQQAEILLEIEKQQIIDAYWGGLNGCINTYEPPEEGKGWPEVKQSGGGAENYYNSTFPPQR